MYDRRVAGLRLAVSILVLLDQPLEVRVKHGHRTGDQPCSGALGGPRTHGHGLRGGHLHRLGHLPRLEGVQAEPRGGAER